MTTPARTVFLGSGSFAVPIGMALAANPRVELLAAVSAPPRPGARGQAKETPVARWAADRGLLLLRPERLRAPETVAAIHALLPELLVLADYGQIVPAELVHLPAQGALNLHPSLLPRHRGASPIPAAILAGDAETGVSLMLMDEGLDSGPIIAQVSHPLAGDETAPELEAALARDAAALLDEVLGEWLAGRLTAAPQPSDGMTKTRPLRRADGRLDPALPVDRLERQVRAYTPWPGSFLETSAGRLVVHRARSFPGGPPARQGGGSEATLSALPGGGLGIVAADGVLELVDVQPAGGRRMSGAELLRGRPGYAGARIENSTAGPAAPGLEAAPDTTRAT